MNTRRTSLVAASVAAVVGLVASMLGTAAANHFSDVPPGSFFDQAIHDITTAGCANGFPDATFRPNSSATRGQFAFWLSNCGGRANWSPDSFVDLDAGQSVDLGPIQIIPPASSGESGDAPSGGAEADPNAQGYLALNAHVNVAHNSTGLNCPCRVNIQFLLNDIPLGSARSMTLGDAVAENGFVDAHAGLARVVGFDSAGDEVLIEVRVTNQDSDTNDLVGSVEMTATYHPFALGT